MAQSRMGLIRPLPEATYTFEYRSTGGSWSTAAPMVGGANSPHLGFTSPVCDELRITATTTSNQTIDRIHLSALSITSGLVFDSSSGLSAEAQPIPTRQKRRSHVTFRVTETTATTHTLTITGIGNQTLDIYQVVFGKVHWEPDYNYSFGSALSASSEFSSYNTFGTAGQRKSKKGRSQTLAISNQSEAKMLDLDHMLSQETSDGFCVFERDTQSAALRQDYCFPVFASMDPFSHNNNLFYSTRLTLIEAAAE